MFRSYFKKDKTTREEIEELNEANLALRVRMDKIMFLNTKNHSAPPKSAQRVFEGRVAA